MHCARTQPLTLMEEITFDCDPWKYFRNQDIWHAGSGTTKGVDADVADAVTEDNLDEAVAFAKAFAEKAGTYSCNYRSN